KRAGFKNSLEEAPTPDHLRVASSPLCRYASRNQPKSLVDGPGDEPASRQSELIVTSAASPAGALVSDFSSSAPASNVSGKGSDLMMKWLPSSTSVLAEPLEQEKASCMKEAAPMRS
ncbi:hypothetical protein MJO28_002042, partial [Puccinia striiformis f. sp. tritici]